MTDKCPWCLTPVRRSGPLTGKDLSVFCSNGHVWAVAGYEINTNFEVRYELGSLLFPVPLTEEDLEPEVETPLFTEPVLGYRTWYVTEGSLRPVSFGGSWVPGVNTAKCAADGHGLMMMMIARKSAARSLPPAGHQAPHPDCSCGLHAYHTHEPCSRLGGAGVAQGAIRAWGDVEVYAKGFRAQHASIIALADNGMYSVHEVAHRYGVPVVPMRELVAVGQEHASPFPKMDLESQEPIRAGFVCGSLVAVRPIGDVWKCRCARCLEMVSVTPAALSAGTAECPTCLK